MKLLTDYYTIFLASILVAFGGIMFYGCSNSEEAEAQRRAQFRSDTVQVITQQVEMRDFSHAFRATGTLEARRQAQLRTVVGGIITEVPVDVGDQVEEGDLLLQVRKIDYELALERAEADLARAEAQLEQAKRERDRTRRLHSNGTASEQDLDQAITTFNEAQAAYLQAEAGRNTAQQNLEDASVTAPYDGVVTEREFEPGEFASEGDVAIEILNLQMLEASLEIPEKYLGLIKEGTEMELDFEANYLSKEGTIVAVSPKVSPETRTFRIRVQVDNEDLSLPSGQFVSTNIKLQNVNKQLAIPEDALARRDGKSFVWIYADGKAKRQPINEGVDQEGWVMVRSGLQQGDFVITEGKSVLDEDYPVEPKNI